MEDLDRNGEEHLLIEAAQKDPGRFAELYDRHFARVYAFITRRVRDRHEAEDLTICRYKQAIHQHADGRPYDSRFERALRDFIRAADPGKTLQHCRGRRMAIPSRLYRK